MKAAGVGTRYDVLIAGAGHAGANAAVALRQHGYGGSIAMLGAERELPYERPPLSKEYLAGEKAFERLLLRPPVFWREQAIEHRPGREVVAVDAAAREVRTAAGETFGYGKLVWAAGGQVRRLSCDGRALAGVHAIRTRADVDALVSELPAAQRVVVIGAGYIGLESAAVLNKLGKRVTVLESQQRVLARVTAEPVSRFYEAEHRAHGVEIRLGCGVSCLRGAGGRVASVELDDGEILPADIVVVGIGVVPAIGPLRDAGAACGEHGVEVDEACRTSLPDVYAVGDCAAHANAFAGGRTIRLESVQNAKDQAVTAAKSILGQDARYHAVPWFWSNQYDLRLQTAGIFAPHDAWVMRGSPAERSFSVVYLRGGRVAALDCVNRPSDYVQGRLLVQAGREVDVSALADGARPLKDWL